MKKVLVLPVLLILMLHAFSQDTTTRVVTKADYLKKSKSQKTAGFVLVGSGIGMVVTGFATFKFDPINWGEGEPVHVDDTGTDLLLIGGLACIVSGSILLSSAHNNKRRAAALSISNQRIPLLQQNGLVYKMQPTVRLRIPL
jgi:hypothetical protein